MIFSKRCGKWVLKRLYDQDWQCTIMLFSKDSVDLWPAGHKKKQSFKVAVVGGRFHLWILNKYHFGISDFFPTPGQINRTKAPWNEVEHPLGLRMTNFYGGVGPPEKWPLRLFDVNPSIMVFHISCRWWLVSVIFLHWFPHLFKFWLNLFLGKCGFTPQMFNSLSCTSPKWIKVFLTLILGGHA